MSPSKNPVAGLERYFAITRGEKHAKFRLAKKLPVEFDEADSLKNLWKTHAEALERYLSFQTQIDEDKIDITSLETPRKSFLDLKIAIAEKIMRSCHLCSRRCTIDRFEGEKGYCQCTETIEVSSIFAHMGEEPELTPSGTIFTMGCTIRCLHCQNWAISQWMEQGEKYRPEQLAKEADALHRSGCRNINMVGGEPTPWLHEWLETFQHVKANIPTVWNSNSYYSPETAELLAGFADIYLLDFKYGPEKCAERISDAPDYWQICTRNHLKAKKNGELIIRVLVLPDHFECCTKPILTWIASNLGAEARVNVMFQYRPEWRAHEVTELQRSLTSEEKDRAVQVAIRAGLRNFIT